MKYPHHTISLSAMKLCVFNIWQNWAHGSWFSMVILVARMLMTFLKFILGATEMTQQTNLTKRWQFNSHSWKDIKACATIMDTQLFALGSLNLKRILCKILQIIMLAMVIKATNGTGLPGFHFPLQLMLICFRHKRTVPPPALAHFDTWIAALWHLCRI